MSDNDARYDLTDSQDRDDRRKHLELVSAVVARMAGAAAAAKGWSITLAGAAFGVALVRDKWYLILLGIVALVFFGALDAMYLHNEKRFRDLYDAIVIDNSVRPLSMDLTVLTVRPRNRSFASWSVLGFYGPLIVGGLILLTATLCHSSKAGEPSQPSSPTQTVTTSTVTITETARLAPPPPPPSSAVPATPSSPAP